MLMGPLGKGAANSSAGNKTAGGKAPNLEDMKTMDAERKKLKVQEEAKKGEVRRRAVDSGQDRACLKRPGRRAVDVARQGCGNAR